MLIVRVGDIENSRSLQSKILFLKSKILYIICTSNYFRIYNEYNAYVKTSVFSYLLLCGRLKVKDSEGQNPAGVVVGLFTVFQVPKVIFLFVCLFCTSDRSAYSPPLIWMSPLQILLSSITMQKVTTLTDAWIPVKLHRVNTMPKFSTKSEIAVMRTSSPQPNPSTTQLVALRPSLSFYP